MVVPQAAVVTIPELGQEPSVKVLAPCHGEMVWLVVRSARHEADEAEPTNVSNLGRRI